MEFSREEQRAIIKFFVQKVKTVLIFIVNLSQFVGIVLKLSLQGRQFHSRSSLGSAVYQSLKHIPKDSYKKCYEKWVGRWQLCLDKEGDYVEK